MKSGDKKQNRKAEPRRTRRTTGARSAEQEQKHKGSATGKRAEEKSTGGLASCPYEPDAAGYSRARYCMGVPQTAQKRAPGAATEPQRQQ